MLTMLPEDAFNGNLVEVDFINLENWHNGQEVDIVASVDCSSYDCGGYYIIHNQEQGDAVAIAREYVDVIEEGL